jgi:serine/threonine protein phosphatase 1
VPATLAALIGVPATHSITPSIDPHCCIQGVAAAIVGHSCAGADRGGNVITIDTGAVYGGELTFLDLAGLLRWLARNAD